MSEPATNHSRLASTASRVGLGIIVLAGLVLGLLISAAYYGLGLSGASRVLTLSPGT